MAKCSFSASLIFPLSNSLSCVRRSTFEQSFKASSRKMTISFSRYCILSFEENIFYCYSDLCLISASSFLILEMWLRQAQRNQASCFLMTCQTFLSISSIALLRSLQASKKGWGVQVVINWPLLYIEQNQFIQGGHSGKVMNIQVRRDDKVVFSKTYASPEREAGREGSGYSQDVSKLLNLKRNIEVKPLQLQLMALCKNNQQMRKIIQQIQTLIESDEDPSAKLERIKGLIEKY